MFSSNDSIFGGEYYQILIATHLPTPEGWRLIGFISFTVKLIGRRSASVVTVCVYRPPGAVMATFINQLSDLLDQLVLLDLPFVTLVTSMYPVTWRDLTVILATYSCSQHVSCSNRCDGNVLDLVITQDSSTQCGQLVSEVAVQSVCFSDHQLVTCRRGLPPPPPVTTTHLYRSLRRIDKQAFRQDILR